MWMFRGINSIPVLVKAGGIIPMQKELFGKEFSEKSGRTYHKSLWRSGWQLYTL